MLEVVERFDTLPGVRGLGRGGHRGVQWVSRLASSLPI